MKQMSAEFINYGFRLSFIVFFSYGKLQSAMGFNKIPDHIHVNQIWLNLFLLSFN